MNTKNHNPLAPLMITETNLSHAWGRVLLHTFNNSSGEIKPLVVSLSGFKSGLPNEDPDIRSALDAFLIKHGKYSVEITAFTIFPHKYWLISDNDRNQLYEIYKDALPRIQAMNPTANSKGLYFQRMIDYGRGPCDGNQLEFIISEFNSPRVRRRSKFQASIFDPEHDLKPLPRQIFPCLQHVSFVPVDGGLAVNAFYAMQYLVGRAYGNFLGLINLGAFMASQMGLNLLQVNIFAGIEQREFTKEKSKELADLVRKKIEP